MGSKPRQFTRPSKAGPSRSRSKQTGSPSPKPRPPRPTTDLDALLGDFSDALSILATAVRSIGQASAETPADPDHDLGEDITTLELGLRELRTVYDKLDVGLREVGS